ncbi:DUF1490 family protein [Parasedimentitalea maritima]|uniref:DUF1490 family protein n=1 Tax=Parasedimentitalea maritima TaxID=2578117 RepID=A0ABY2UYX3_9RHOB|nr:DUF1490 family protein [Zongyanglinia marina]
MEPPMFDLSSHPGSPGSGGTVNSGSWLWSTKRRASVTAESVRTSLARLVAAPSERIGEVGTWPSSNWRKYTVIFSPDTLLSGPTPTDTTPVTLAV